MQQIGELTFIEMTGNVSRFGTILEEKRRPGRSGQVYRDIGQSAARFSLQTKSTFKDLELAVSGLRQINSYKGTFKSLSYNGEIFSDVAILDVQSNPPQKHAAASDGSAYNINSSWTMQLTRQE